MKRIGGFSVSILQDPSVDGHLTPEHVRDVQPSTLGCEDCLKIGGYWVHLRICTECGHVGCCDNSPNRHATKHFHATKHPVIRSFEPGEPWGYCYPDEAFVEEVTAFAG